MALLYDTEHYPMLVSILDSLKKGNIGPDTVGGFLFGCFQDSYGDVVNKYCSPVCISGIQPSKADVVKCEAQVWVVDSLCDGLEETEESGYCVDGNKPQFKIRWI